MNSENQLITKKKIFDYYNLLNYTSQNSKVIPIFHKSNKERVQLTHQEIDNIFQEK